MTTLTRQYHFSASHRLHSPHLSATENARIYGKCNNPFGHGHNYVLAVTVSGDVNENTGLLLPVAKLDRLVNEKVLKIFAHRNMNFDVAPFASLVPTTENLAIIIAELLAGNWPGYIDEPGVRLARIHIQETERNGFELLVDTNHTSSHPDTRLETIIANA